VITNECRSFALNFGQLKELIMPRENDLEGQQDMGGKHGGQKGQPKSPPRPHADPRDGDVAVKRDDGRAESPSTPAKGR
jgi:hypothetical protein